MKLQSFYIIAILICVYITLAPTIEAYTVSISLQTDADLCRIWAEDSNGNRIAGDGDYHECTDFQKTESFSLQNETYWVHAKVQGSTEDEKVRGPYDIDTCFILDGTVFDWDFDQTKCFTVHPSLLLPRS
ncbi:12159_t:CDS:2 [Gigaspora margarita]|uniref:12159_t:CDS:1 n=1 Tax=Gigaspora margarita TaxID=4874 RepID=A0ABN7VKP4_GIGMA|nr:12159_t:CDS:2 [Gigaspora margarita]